MDGGARSTRQVREAAESNLGVDRIHMSRHHDGVSLEVKPHSPSGGETGRRGKRKRFAGVNGVQLLLDNSSVHWLKQGFPGLGHRRGFGSLSEHAYHKSVCCRLPIKEWPSHREVPLWPSSPSVNELMMMLSKGVSPNERPSLRENTFRVGKSEFNENVEMLRAIVNRQVVGIRSDVLIPKRYLRHFRYRWNFLILTSPVIPIALARFLVTQWVTCPSNLWLEKRCTLKQYLRAVPCAIKNSIRKRSSPTNFQLEGDDVESSLSFASEDLD